MRHWYGEDGLLEMKTQCTVDITKEFTWKGNDCSSKAGALAQSLNVF